ncbi:MarR family winged helix-turn-helix transcriptional regulator [Lacticaseibacillus sp. GG6-2]
MVPQDNVELFGQLFATLAQGVLQNLSIEELDLTPQQIMTLVMVYSHEGASMSRLTTLMGTTAPQLTRTMQSLETRYLVRREHNVDNRRVVNVYRTTAGDAIVEAHMRRVQARIAARLKDLSAQDHHRLDADMADIISLFAKIGIVSLKPKPLSKM